MKSRAIYVRLASAAVAALLMLVTLASCSAPTVATKTSSGLAGPEEGGQASGVFTDRGDRTELRHAYAVQVRPRRAKVDEFHVILSDRPVPKKALDDLASLPVRASKGEFRAVELVLSAAGTALRMEFHHDTLPSGLSVIGVPRDLRISGLPGGPVSGSFSFDEPGEYSWSARGTFEAPIYRPERAAAAMIPADASPAERARARLAAEGIEWSEQVFLRRCFDGDLEAVELFLEGGMSPNTRTEWESALSNALSQKHLAVVKKLLAAGADPNEKKDQYGTTPLLEAAGTGEVPLVSALLEVGADPNAVNQYRYTALMSASGEGRIEMVKVLVAAGARVTARDTTGGTALSYAVFGRHLEVAKYLIESGADVRRDRDSLIALARKNKDKEMERLIREAAAKQKGEGAKPKKKK